ncbi:MAG: aldehyde dehydrogenase, partial [Betaproteobacteria bacterium]
PGGVINLVTGDADALAETLAAHADVDAFWWPAATPAQCARVEALSVSNLKRTWAGDATAIDTRSVLEHAVQVKNVWVPYGV